MIFSTEAREVALGGDIAGLSGIVFSIYIFTGLSLATAAIELDATAALVLSGTLLMGGAGFVGGALIGIFIQGLIQTYITVGGAFQLVSEDVDRLIAVCVYSDAEGPSPISRLNGRYVRGKDGVLAWPIA